MLGEIVKPKEPGLIGNLALYRIAKMIKGLEIAEYLMELGVRHILRLITTTLHHLMSPLPESTFI
jgi:hypothetical protein